MGQLGLKKVPSGSPGQVDFPYGQVTFHSHWSDLQGIWQVVSQLNHFKKEQAMQAKLVGLLVLRPRWNRGLL